MHGNMNVKLFGRLQKKVFLKSVILFYPWIFHSFPSSNQITAADTNKDW